MVVVHVGGAAHQVRGVVGVVGVGQANTALVLEVGHCCLLLATKWRWYASVVVVGWNGAVVAAGHCGQFVTPSAGIGHGGHS